MLPQAFLAAKRKLFPKSLIAFDQMKICFALEPLSHVTQTEHLSQTVSILLISSRWLLNAWAKMGVLHRFESWAMQSIAKLH